MAYTLSTIKANSANYGGSRSTSNIKYIVIHYTANDGDTATNNGNYFKNNNVGSSAHYFVDDNSIVNSVADNYVAYSVGGSTQGSHHPLYKTCTNSNSLSIEMCDTLKNGKVEITEATLSNVVEFVKVKMKQYNISISNVIRHYDINGKKCPNCNNFLNDSTWNKFKERISNNSSNSNSNNSSNSNSNNWVLSLQKELNKQGFKDSNGSKLVEDGIAGTKTLSACPMLKKDARGNITKLLQEKLVYLGYSTNGVDGIFGNGTYNATKKYQSDNKLTSDGIVGNNTWEKLLNLQ